MEDSVGEEERREQGETAAQAMARHGEEQDAAAAEAAGGGGGGGEPGEEGGFLSAMASKIGAAMSGANGGGGGGGEDVGNATAVHNGEEEKKDEVNGGGGIFHKLLSSSPPASSPASGATGTEEVKMEGRDQEAGGEQAGILSAMASKIGMAMSGANGDGDRSSEADAKMSNGDAVDGSKGESVEKGDEANGGGILSAMASRIGMAMSGANGDGDHSNEDDAKASNGDAVDHTKDEEKGDEANGGILSSMASKIGMAMSGANGDGGNHGGSGDRSGNSAMTTNDEAVHGSSKDEDKKGEANGGGIVEQIISNLPSDDQAPDAEEASLLIAIIDD
ncbi:hypothetical protein ACP70R_016505 [Stipagrostis hirtigluma subsp. patula]